MKKLLSLLLALCLLSTSFAAPIAIKPVNAADYKFLISVDDGNGNPKVTEVDSLTILFPEPEAPMKKGYIFKGWKETEKDKFIDFSKEIRFLGAESFEYFDVDGNRQEIEAQKVSSTLSIVAEYEKVDFTFTFDADDGSPTPESQTIGVYETLTKPEDPKKEGYVFKGWTPDYNFEKTLDIEKAIVPNEYTEGYYSLLYTDKSGAYNFKKGDVKLKALYEKKDDKKDEKKDDKKEEEAKTFKVSFDTDGGTPVPDVQEIEENGRPEYPAENPKKDGYTFEYWALDGERAPEFSYITVMEDLTFTAVYKVASKEVFTVRFETSGGSPEPSNQSIQSGDKALRPQTNPSKEGYTFTDWYDANGKYDFDEPVERNIILYAKYEKTGESHDKSNRKDIDIDDKDYDKAIIQYKDPFFNGYPDKTFKPDAAITRAEMATVFTAILGIKDKAVEGKVSFNDIDGHWAKDNILKVAEYGLLKGYPDGSFKPDKKMSRAEIATIINMYWKSKGFEANTADAGITDIDGHWAKTHILALYNHRFMDTYSNKTFMPDAPLDRAVVAQLLNRITDRALIEVNEQKFTDTPPSHWAYKEISTAASKVEK